jgi:drug/metabolite transporter (DMT)-like permease
MEKEAHIESAKCSTAGAVTFGIGLLSGTFSALFCKMAYDTQSVGLDGETEKYFAKPMMMLLIMFAAMTPAMSFWYIQQSMLKPDDRDNVTWKTMAVLIVPSICDLLCTLLLLVAQLYITASMWQMLRGSVVVITALLKSFLLKHRLRTHMWVGVGIIAVAMVCVALTSFFGAGDTDATSRDPRIGVVLVLLGCLAQGVQYVFEEKVMAVDDAPPLVVIGCEGIWGFLLTLFVVYPIAYLIPGQDNGSFENPFDAMQMIGNNFNLQLLLVGFVVTVTAYNCMAVYVTKYLSAIWHAILDNFRPATIWVMDLLIYYTLFPGSGFGEAWSPASWLQLGGLLLLFLGTAIYDGTIMFGIDKDGYEAIESSEETKSHTPISMASPSLMRSPLIYREGRTASKETELSKLASGSAKDATYSEI